MVNWIYGFPVSVEEYKKNVPESDVSNDLKILELYQKRLIEFCKVAEKRMKKLYE